MSTDLKTMYNEWCEKFLALPVERMTEVQSKVFISLILADQKELPPQITDEFAFKVMKARAAAIGLEIDDAALAFFSIGIASTVGEVVMYTYVLRYVQLKHDLGKITMQGKLFKVAFSAGFPSQESLDKVWDEQKGFKLGQKFDNLLDQAIPLV